MYTIFLWRNDSFFGDGYEATPPHTEIDNDKQYFLQNIDKILLGAILCEQGNITIIDFDLNNFTRKDVEIYAEQCEKALMESDIFKDAYIEVNWQWASEEYDNGYISFSIENFNPLNVLKFS